MQASSEVVVVDNGGGGDELVSAGRLPGVRVVPTKENLGFAGGCNLGAAESKGDLLVFLNPDTTVEAGALEQLAARLADEKIGIVMARLRLLDHPELLNSAGTIVHLSGLAWAGGYGRPAESVDRLEEVPAPSGAALALRREVFEQLGRFTEELFMYHEDVELGWRARLHGLRVVIDPAADVYHEYEFGRHREQTGLRDRNRLVFVLTAYSLRLLLVLAPLLVATELGMLALAARQGWLRGKLGGWWWCIRHLRWLGRHRQETQRLRRVRDRELAGFLTPVLDPSMVALPRFVGPINGILRTYWAVARRAL